MTNDEKELVVLRGARDRLAVNVARRVKDPEFLALDRKVKALEKKLHGVKEVG